MNFINLYPRPKFSILRLILLFLIIKVIVFSSSLSFALTVDQIQNANIQNDLNQQRIIRKQRDLEKQKNIIEIEKVRQNRIFENDLDENLIYNDKKDCINLSEIKILGSTKYSEKFFRVNLLDIYQKRCLTKSDLKNIRKLIENFYIKKGYTTTRVYFDPKTLASKILTLVVIEGRIEKLQINNNSKLDKWLPYRNKTKLFFAFPFKSKGIFNLRDFEQGIDQINRLQSYNAKINIKPGLKKGYSQIILDNNLNNPMDISFSYNNLGQKSSGKHKRSLALNLDSLIGLYDNLYINYNEDNEPSRLKKFSKASYFSFSIPFGYWTLSGGYSSSDYLTTIEDPVLSYKVSGSNISKSLSLDRILYRNQIYKVKFGSKFSTKDISSFIEDVKNNAGTNKFSTIDIFFENIIYSKYGTLSIKPLFSKGLDILNATSDKKDILSNEAHAQYKLARISAYFNTSLDRFNLNLPWQYIINFDGQISEDSLFGIERFSIGGPYSIRGFEEISISGDSGYFFNNDLKIPLRQIISPKLAESKFFNYKIANFNINNLISKINITLFYDYGYVRSKKIINSTGEGYMSGAGIKFSYINKNIRSNLTFARGLNSPKFIQNIYDQAKDKEVIYYDLTLQF